MFTCQAALRATLLSHPGSFAWIMGVSSGSLKVQELSLSFQCFINWNWRNYEWSLQLCRLNVSSPLLKPEYHKLVVFIQTAERFHPTQNYRIVSLKETKLLLKSVLRRTMKNLTLVTGLSVPERFWFAALWMWEMNWAVPDSFVFMHWSEDVRLTEPL